MANDILGFLFLTFFSQPLEILLSSHAFHWNCPSKAHWPTLSSLANPRISPLSLFSNVLLPLIRLITFSVWVSACLLSWKCMLSSSFLHWGLFLALAICFHILPGISSNPMAFNLYGDDTQHCLYTEELPPLHAIEYLQMISNISGWMAHHHLTHKISKPSIIPVQSPPLHQWVSNLCLQTFINSHHLQPLAMLDLHIRPGNTLLNKHTTALLFYYYILSPPFPTFNPLTGPAAAHFITLLR